MNKVHFDHSIAGRKTIWILQFPKDLNAHVDFFIPSPEGKNQWLTINYLSNKEVLGSLDCIQSICDVIKQDCETQVGELGEYENKTNKISQGLNTLDELIKQFNEIMRRFKKNLPPEEEETPS